MITSDLLSDLKSLLPDSHIEEKLSPNQFFGNDGDIVISPKTENDISTVLHYANENNKKMNIAGNGTKRGFGGTENKADILLSLSDYKGVIEHTVGDMTITVKAGTPFQELQDYLAKYNQKISLDPSHPEESTIGGVIAANDSGPKRLGYGSARDHVIGLRMAYPNGEIIRSGGKVVKNVAGYDMNKLFIGSMGTLGVVTEITLKLRPLPKHESLILLTFEKESREEIRSFAVQFLDSMMEPVSLELLNPELSEKLTGQKVFTLAIAFEDVESSVHYQEEFVKNMKSGASQMTILAQQEAKEFWKRFNNLFPNGQRERKGQAAEAVIKVGVKNLDVIQVLKESDWLEDAHNVSVLAHGGLGHGLCQVHLQGAQDDIIAAINSLRKTVKQLTGYAVIKHLPLALRQVIDVWGEKPSYFFLLEGIKTKIDPKKTLNPKRYVGGL
ncbi:FAD-binding oxidoreductase [Alteribacillus bidgolensis]|uniref:Glycolate oxidase FAD binding subunit n=1 Tax=Alteribacillus bidgolensis TaxID=930129 RepID=A0A1G8HG78_9BACI|nr:FAD-binding oxidoreductase [Alteribacillus bidgolensis]SDI05619.1 glycolate oxidase FAD binding subunit [Alteribacillus bidgolensis]